MKQKFSGLVWEENKVSLNEIDFWLQVYLKEDIRNKREGFVFYKDKKLIDMYVAFFNSTGLSESKLDSMVEVGMWDGGSAVFWNEVLEPKKFIGIDILEKPSNRLFEEYKKKNKENFRDYWGVSQTDKISINEIIANELKENNIDLVFDDASHRYQETLECFNILFPHLRKGGYYIIEDWAWGHWPHEDSSVYPAYTEPTRLVFELIEVAANIGLIENIYVCSGFVALKKGNIDLMKEEFHLHNYIKRRTPSLKDRIKRRVKILLGRKV